MVELREFHRLVSLCPPSFYSNHNFKKLHHNKLSRFSFINFHKNPYLHHQYVVLQSSHIVCASASASSSADYSGQLLDSQEKKKERIAGIDQDELVEPTVLADPDSCFCEFRGVRIHHKTYDAESEGANKSLEKTQSVSHPVKKIGFPMILLHGFGASVYSWSRVMKALAEVVGSKVVAFDRPAFGLTSRLNPFEKSASGNGDAKPLNPYSMAFSVLATLYFIDRLGSQKAILVGHSAGSLVAVNAYFEAPERVAALILVAPAIVAPLIAHKEPVKRTQLGGDNQIQEDSSNKNSLGNPFVQLGNILSKFAQFVSQAIMNIVKGMANMLNSLYKKLLSAILRSAFAVMLVRMIIDKFGIAAVKNAWHDSNLVTEHVLQGYTKPLRTKNWDRALVEYTAAMLTDTAPESSPPLSKRLHEISCPVLIVTGDDDRLVPAWNAERLSRAIPGSCFEVIKHCGHLPHEEKVDEFISIVQKFLQSV
ncbi:uncharacterized protein LOC21400132 [Morus notabilis]|uniref:uncharacterized protein LOC21400132 n=1 Tax=Morus notabilis TaxID=981085 RepID=UPI000CED0BA7|nr:uncharacterized protein LOC21400132 [Morus notabilis]